MSDVDKYRKLHNLHPPKERTGFVAPKNEPIKWGTMAKGSAAGLLGTPVDLVNLLTRVKEPVMGSEWIGERLGADTDSLEFQAGQFLDPLAGVAKVAKFAAPAVAGLASLYAMHKMAGPGKVSGPGRYQQGVITKGGSRRLNAWTEITPDNLKETLSKWAELDNPSVAVSAGAPTTAFGDISLIAKADALDPLRRPGELYARDVYSQLRNDFLPNDTAVNRLKNRFPGGMHNYRSKDVADTEYQDVIDNSRQFRSFKDFERSNEGAGVQVASDIPEQIAMDSIELDIEKYLRNKEYAYHPGIENYGAKNTSRVKGLPTYIESRSDKLKYFAANGDKNAQELLSRLRTLPSAYGELKISGPLSINRDNFAGAINQSGIIDVELKELLHSKGIELYDMPQPGLDQSIKSLNDHRAEVFRMMQQLTEGSFDNY